MHALIAKELEEVGPSLTELMTQWADNPKPVAKTKREKRALKVLAKIRLVAKNLKGSSGYKQCRRNEIRALMKNFSTPALFMTLNPSDLTHPLVGSLGGIKPEVWREMTSRERGLFVAKNPCAAAQFFDEMMQAFIKYVLRYGQDGGGPFWYMRSLLRHRRSSRERYFTLPYAHLVGRQSQPPDAKG
jgi:hypothetical protein